MLFEVAKGTDRSGKAIHADTLFWIASISKQFVGAAAVRLASQGKLDIGDPVAKHIPGWPAEALRRKGVDCTIEFLLSHQCGMPRELAQATLYRGHLTDSSQQAALLERLNGMELDYTPGTDREYSNLGFNLAAVMVAKVSGMPFEDYLRQEFFGPLGLKNTGINPDSTTDFRPRLAPGHLLTLFGPMRSDRWGWLPPELPSGLGGAGSVYSSASELERWNRGLFRDGLLTPHEVDELTRSRRDDKDYGFGITKKKKKYGHRIAHNGALSPYGYGSYAGYIPETDTTVVVFRNQDLAIGDSDPIGMGLLKLAHGMTVDELDEPVDGPTKWAGAILGSFIVLSTSGLVGLLLLSCLLPLSKTRVEWSIIHMLTAWFAVYINHSFGANLLSVDLLSLGLFALTLPIGLQRLGTRPLHSGLKATLFSAAFMLAIASGMAVLFGFLLTHLVWVFAAGGSTVALIRVFDHRNKQEPAVIDGNQD